jgi:hypothetical protein
MAARLNDRSSTPGRKLALKRGAVLYIKVCCHLLERNPLSAES